MAVINTSDLTTKEIDGTGVFDELMAAATEHLNDQFDKKRIQGSDYSKVYLGMMDSVLAQSIQFILNKQQSDKQADLLAQQTLKTIQETDLVEQQVLVAVQEVLASQANVKKIEQDVINAQIQGKVLINQAEKIEQEILVEQQNVLNMQQQVLKSTAEVSILGKQETKIDKENLILTYQHDFTMPAEKDLVIARKNLTDKQALTEEAQELKIDAEKLLVDANEAKVSYEAITLLPKQVFVMDAEEAKIRKEIEIMSHRSNNEAAQLAVINNQRDKLAAEKDLLIEKKWTEQAQRLNTVNGLTVTGVIGRQNSLYEAQTAGFHRDAEQKLTKILADTWNVRRSTADDTPANNTNRLDDSNIGAVIEKAMQGISVTPPP